MKTGKCQVVINNGQGVFKSKELLEGSGFGEVALMYNHPRTATVRALQESTCWVLDGTVFKSIVIKSV